MLTKRIVAERADGERNFINLLHYLKSASTYPHTPYCFHHTKATSNVRNKYTKYGKEVKTPPYHTEKDLWRDELHLKINASIGVPYHEKNSGEISLQGDQPTRKFDIFPFLTNTATHHLLEVLLLHVFILDDADCPRTGLHA